MAVFVCPGAKIYYYYPGNAIMTLNPSGEANTPPTQWGQILGIAVGLTALLTVMLAAFALPPLNSGPHNVPIAVAGPAPTASQLSVQLQQDRPGAFEVTEVANPADARGLILDREVYGAIVVDPPNMSVLTASAASPAVAQLLGGVATGLGEAQGVQVPVEDVRPMPDDDPNGAGLGAAALPLVLGGWIAAVILLVAVHGAARQAGGALAFAILGGFGLTAVLQFWFGSLDGNYVVTSIAVALAIAATAWTILGLRSALGMAGLGVGAALLILLGNPLSGSASAGGRSASSYHPGGWQPPTVHRVLRRGWCRPATPRPDLLAAGRDRALPGRKADRPPRACRQDRTDRDVRRPHPDVLTMDDAAPRAVPARLGFTVEAAQDSHSQPYIIVRDVHIKIGSLA